MRHKTDQPRVNSESLGWEKSVRINKGARALGYAEGRACRRGYLGTRSKVYVSENRGLEFPAKADEPTRETRDSL